MSRSKPIWNEVEACIYQGSKSFGAKDTSEIKTKVGSSSSNSHLLGTMKITRRFEIHSQYGPVCVFKQSIDDHILNTMYFVDDNGKAGEFIEKITIFNRCNFLIKLFIKIR